MRKSSNLKTNDCGEVYRREGLLMAVLEREKEEREITLKVREGGE